jgi:endogenous inhibitor of DNA gyrase (YacG/DUF329 family)
MNADSKNQAAGTAAGTKVARCPVCGQASDDGYRPFCSKRCADVDLGRWLNGSYAIPVSEDDDEDGDGAEQATGEAGGEPH